MYISDFGNLQHFISLLKRPVDGRTGSEFRYRHPAMVKYGISCERGWRTEQERGGEKGGNYKVGEICENHSPLYH